jgi:hypothetical protein
MLQEHIETMLVTMADYFNGRKDKGIWEVVSETISQKHNGRKFRKITLQSTYTKLVKKHDDLEDDLIEVLQCCKAGMVSTQSLSSSMLLII